jgi:hypothetical protein
LYPSGTLIRVVDRYYLVTQGEQRTVTEKGMQDNHLQPRFAIKLNEELALPFGPDLDRYEPSWGSPDIQEQKNDPGPDKLDLGGKQPELG